MTMTATVKEIELLKTINADSNVYLVSFDNNSTAYYISNPVDAMSYLNMLVDYETADNIYDGKVVPFISTIAEKRVVNVINRTEHIKLFSDVVDNSSTICFKDIEMGTTYNNCVLYCSRVTYDSSIRSDWLDLTVSDKQRRVSHLRIFSPDVKQAEQFAGRYIRCDIRRTKFGLTTQDIFLCEKDYAPNPELDIAETYIKGVFKDDSDMLNALEATNVLPFMREYVGYERGCLLLECAMEIDLAIEIGNVTPGIDTNALAKAFIADKFWCLMPNSHFSKDFLNVHRCIQHKTVFDSKVQDIIGGNVPNVPAERPVYDKIRELVKSIVVIRKGDVYAD